MISPIVPSTSDPNLQRALLSLDGLSVGDALGQLLSTCARTARAVVARDGLPGPHWWHTDDTQMGMAIVEELAVARKIVQGHVSAAVCSSLC